MSVDGGVGVEAPGAPRGVPRHGDGVDLPTKVVAKKGFREVWRSLKG